MRVTRTYSVSRTIILIVILSMFTIQTSFSTLYILISYSERTRPEIFFALFTAAFAIFLLHHLSIQIKSKIRIEFEEAKISLTKLGGIWSTKRYLNPRSLKAYPQAVSTGYGPEEMLKILGVNTGFKLELHDKNKRVIIRFKTRVSLDSFMEEISKFYSTD